VQKSEWTDVVEAASRAPSIHNTQPWRFTATADGLNVYTDPRRALHALDPSGRQRIISCGVAVEFAAVALHALGRDVDVALCPDPADPDLVATLSVTGERPPTAEDSDLAAAIERRHTSRAPFLPQTVPAALVDELQRVAGSFTVWFKSITESEEEVATVFLIARAEELEQGEPEYLAELQSWMRTDPSAVDGIPVEAVPSGDPATRPSNWLIRDFVVGSRPADRPPFHPVDPDAPPPPVERPTVVLLGTDDDDRRAWLTAGRALGQVLLRATLAGLAASPLTQALDWPATRAQLRRRLSLVGHPQMLLRLGYPTGDGGAITGRRPVSDVLSFVEE
jgi:nitroreductase